MIDQLLAYWRWNKRATISEWYRLKGLSINVKIKHSMRDKKLDGIWELKFKNTYKIQSN